MKKTLTFLAALAMMGCSELKFDSSDNRTVGNDGWNRDENGRIIPHPTPSAESEIDEVLND